MANLSNINNKFLVTTGGNVLIGQTAAVGSSILQVTGSVTITGGGDITLNPGNSNKIILTPDVTSHYITANGYWIDIVGNAAEVFRVFGGVGGTSEYFRVAGDGNVGIGTITPDAKLDVEDTVTYQIMAKYNATNYTEYGYYGLNVVGGGNPYLFKLQGTERIRITSAGNIQFAQDGYINTNTADGSDNLSLQLSGGGTFGDARGACIALAGNENGNGGLMQLRAGDGSVGGIRYYTGGSERMRLAGRLISFNSTTGVQEIRGDAASAKFAIGNMGDASSQMMVSSRGFLTLNTSNTGSALDATERMKIDGSGAMTYTGAEPGTTGVRFQGSGTCNGYSGSVANFYVMDVMRDSGNGKSMNVQGTIDIAAGYGIGFGASAGGGATSTLLDDYEEGGWTPVASDFTGNQATVNTTNSTGVYTKIGDLVYWRFTIQMTSKASMISGETFKVSGFPFTSSSIPGNWYRPSSAIIKQVTFSGFVNFSLVASTTYGYFFDSQSAGAGGTIPVSDIADNCALSVTGVYKAN